MKCQDKNGQIGSSKGCTNKKLDKLIGYHRHHKTHKITPTQYKLMQGDASSESARKFYENVKDLTAIKIFWGGQYFADFLPVSGGWLFWDKLTGNSDFSDGELAWCSRGKRIRKYTQRWCGCVISCDCKLNAIGGNNKHDTRTRIHPTQKPVELHARILEDFSKEGDTVLDCFGGSGTTLIACEITNRKCLMMEISPGYCDIIINRYEKLIPMKKIERIR